MQDDAPAHTIMYGPYRGKDISMLPLEYIETLLETCDPESDINLFEAAHYWYKAFTGKNWREEG